jgi:hypothetical protein
MASDAQEEVTSAFQLIQDMGVVDTGYGFSDWATLAPIVPKYIQPAYGGVQKIGVVVRLVDMHDQPLIK